MSLFVCSMPMKIGQKYAETHSSCAFVLSSEKAHHRLDARDTAVRRPNPVLYTRIIVSCIQEIKIIFSKTYQERIEEGIQIDIFARH